MVSYQNHRAYLVRVTGVEPAAMPPQAAGMAGGGFHGAYAPKRPQVLVPLRRNAKNPARL